MSRPIRCYMPGIVYEVTVRTFQERFLLRPSAEVRDVIVGIIARARSLFGVRVHAFFFMSNHAHLLLSADGPDQISNFMSYVNGLVARKVGRLNGWRGTFWGARSRIIPILDDVTLVRRLKYLMAQGVKEGLVASVLDWPGASANPALLGDMKLQGTWVDQNDFRAARRYRPETRVEDFTSHPVLELSPLPCWSHLSPEELRARHQQLAAEIEEEARIARKGVPVLGVKAVLANNPQTRPESPEHSPAPACHAATTETRQRFARWYKSIVAVFREKSKQATEYLTRAQSAPDQAQEPMPRFPAGSMPRPRWTVPPDGSALIDIVIDLQPRSPYSYSSA